MYYHKKVLAKIILEHIVYMLDQFGGRMMDMFSSLVFGIAVIAISAYLGIKRDKTGRRVQRLNFLFGILFVLFAMWVVGAFVVHTFARIMTLTPENFVMSMLIMKVVVNLVVGIPGLTLLMRLVSMRCRDAGYRPGLAYLGAVPVLQILFWLWLLFPGSKAAPALASNA
jgi:hypothetical protein